MYFGSQSNLWIGRVFSTLTDQFAIHRNLYLCHFPATLTMLLLDPSLPTSILTLISVIFILSFFWYETGRKRLRVPHLSGPPGLPVVGNLFGIKRNAAEQFRKWSQYYGDVFQIQLGHIPVVVVNSAASTKAIFSGHSNALSSRPTFFTFHQGRLNSYL